MSEDTRDMGTPTTPERPPFAAPWPSPHARPPGTSAAATPEPPADVPGKGRTTLDLEVATTEEIRNAGVVRRYLVAYETQDLDEYRTVVHPDVIGHGAGTHLVGRATLEKGIATPGLTNTRIRIDDLFAARDRVTTAVTLTYTHTVTGRDVTMTGLNTFRLEDGLIVEIWGESHLYGLLSQLGLVPRVSPTLT